MTEKTAELKYFFWRRLHSLIGIVPVGAFLLEHFFSNSYVFQGAGPFNEMVAKLQGLPLLLFLEVGLIGLPILFHVFLGFIILYSAKQNVFQYGTYRNWMYFFQRVTGIIAVAFIFYHVYETRIEAALDHRLVTYDYMKNYFSSYGVQIFYIIGILSVVFHFANGISTALITWGVTVSKRSQQVSAAFSWLVFLGMGFWGIQLLYAFR